MPRPVALITGASSGLGSVFARKLAGRGYDLILVARRLDRLQQLAGELSPTVSATPIAADLSTNEGIQSVAARILAEPRFSLLVNNAGYGAKGRFWETPVEVQQGMHRVHIDATLQLSHSALRAMVPRDEGAIINVSSVAAFARSPANVSYCATKGWINHFTEGLYLELSAMGSKVKVQALCPGFTYTEFHDTLGVSRDKIPRWLWLDANRVVDESLAGLDRGKLFVIPAWQYKLVAMFLPRIPTWMRLRIEAASPHSRDRVSRGAQA